MIGFGVNLPQEAISENIVSPVRLLDMLRPNWWQNYLDLIPEDDRYVPMIRRVPLPHQYALGRRNPLRYFFLGNEPERDDQDDTTPEQFTAGMRGWIAHVGKCFAVPGVQLNDRGFAWLDEFRRISKPLPPTMRWHVHIYANNGQDWQRQWLRFLRWMQDNRCHRPVVVSETASISTTVGNQLDVMTTAYNTMRQNQWLVGIGWFSAHYSTFKREYERTDLFNKKGHLTVLGEWFRTFAAQNNAPRSLDSFQIEDDALPEEADGPHDTNPTSS